MSRHARARVRCRVGSRGAYLAQSLVLGLVYYGYGLGLFGRLSLAEGCGRVPAVYGAQVVTSRLWLRRYRFGPLEWLWRTLTDGHGPSGPIRPRACATSEDR